MLAAAALLGPSLGCGGTAANQGQGRGGIPVELQEAHPVAVDETTEYVATLKSRGSALIMPEVEGQVTEILVRAGDRITVGMALMQIDPAKQQATVKIQEDIRVARLADLAYARQQQERVKGLFAAGITSRQELDRAEAALEAAQAEVDSLEAQVREQQVQLRYYRVTAPMDGIVGDIPVRVGDRVTVSTLLTTVDRPGALEVYISVPAERAPRLRRGLPVRLLDAAGALLAESRIDFVSPQVDDETQTVLAKARIANEQGQLRPAQLVRAQIVWESRERPVVPLLAVSRIGGQHFAFVAEDANGSLVARQRPLRVGEVVGNNYVVLEGIEPGDRVIVSGTQFLMDGAPVSPKG